MAMPKSGRTMPKTDKTESDRTMLMPKSGRTRI